MNEKNSPQPRSEELMYLPPNYVAREEGLRNLQERGFPRSFVQVFGPVFKENPFPFIGISLLLGSFAACSYYEYKGQRDKAFTMLRYKSVFGVFTIASCGLGFMYREHKAKKLRKEQQMEELE